MKKSLIKKLCKYSAISLFAAGFAIFMPSCDIGLGPGVDMQAPRVAITSHQDNDSVGQTFRLYGTAEDNEKLTKLTVDFDDADIHYQIEPGSEWQKRTSTSNGWQTVSTDSNNYCSRSGDTWNWSIDVDTSEKISTKTGNTYNILAVVADSMGNSGKDSKMERSLIVDEQSPKVSIYKPELFKDTQDASNTETMNYAILNQKINNNEFPVKDGNVISKLFNGTIQLFGRQENALSFKALRIEFDNGNSSTLSKTTVNAGGTSVSSIEEVLALGDAILGETKPASTTYFSKTLTGAELREWSLTVTPEEWATNDSGIANGLNDGIHVTINGEDKTKPHIIRIVTTSLSTSNAWERSVLGYFLWNPAADKPWISIYAGHNTEAEAIAAGVAEVYPGSNISGQIQDDDGIASFVSTLYQKNDENSEYELYSASNYTNPKNHELPQTNAGEKPKYAAWKIEAPSRKGTYKLVLEVKDVYGASDTVTKYFKTSDVSAPKIEITLPQDGSSAIVNAEGNITFTGTVTDDGEIDSVAMVWLNPAKRDDPSNKIKFLTGTDSIWNSASLVGFEDTDGNKIFKFDIGTKPTKYDINRQFNLFDLGIDGNTKQLVAQDFIFRAYDGTTASVKAITLTGDTSAPELTLGTITINGQTEDISSTPTFASNAKGKAATITGTWSDKFTSTIDNTSKIKSIKIVWGSGSSKKEVFATWNGNSWTASVDKAPDGGGTITATITDFGGNTKTVQGAVRIETDALGLSRVGCLNDDGSYNAGKELYLTLEFTKNTNINTTAGSPTLTLNNKGIAYFDSTTYTTGYGSGTPVHVFKYTVGKKHDASGNLINNTEETDIDKLSVNSIQANGAKWIDSATAASANPENITSKVAISSSIQNLADTRNIKIDTTAPKVKSVKRVTSDGSYNAGKDILIQLEFDEDVTITNSASIRVNFSNPAGKKAENAIVSGSKSVFLTYSVQGPATGAASNSGDNTTAGGKLTFASIEHTGVTVTDNAGNQIQTAGWTLAATEVSLGNIVIDTTKPAAPTFRAAHGASTSWNPDSVIFSYDGTQFGLSGETGATIEYTIDGGGNWLPYSNKTIELKNNGRYTVQARQTDKAGNKSEATDAKIFTIEKGELFTGITAKTVSGTYSTKSTTKKIEGKIQFRKAVTIANGSKVRLNVKRGTANHIDVPLSFGTGKEFTFEYTIEEGDSIYMPADSEDANYVAATDSKYGCLDVIGWNLDKTGDAYGKLNATFESEGTNVTITPEFPSLTDSKRFSEKRKIKIVTGKPQVITNGISLTEQVDSTTKKVSVKLMVTFDREVSKVGETITITQDTTEYHVPTVLTVDEYNSYHGKIPDVMEANYTKGMNGASKSFENDTSTKYILNFYKADGTTILKDTDSELVTAFTTTAKAHIVTIPVVADEVYTVDASGNKSDKGYTLVIDLSDTYKLPVKGAKYKLEIPENSVTDEVQNKNVAITKNDLQSQGVEPPFIRLLKPSYEITGITGSKTTPQNIASNTRNASADMTKAQSAKMRIDCRTPGAVLKYAANEIPGTAVTINSKTATSTKGTKPAAPTTLNTYTKDSIIPLAGDKAVGSYNNASGVKIAIKATATANGESENAYEYAARTVLKFHIGDTYDDHDYAKGSNTAAGNGLKFNELKVWVTGGDATSGGNSLDPFPLSWATPGNFKLMSGNLSGNNKMSGNFYWVTWDITTTTYHGFVIGTVPSDAEKNGPTVWFASECSWVTLKNNYPLYPGETLVMDTTDVSPGFAFRDKNKGER